MDSNKIVQEFEGKTIFVTGVTGFIAKILVEKLIRVQPKVKKLFLLIRAPDTLSAEKRLHEKIIDSGLFRVIRDNLGENLTTFISSKIVPIAGDVSRENFGITDTKSIEEICGEIDFIVNMAATTRFDERYDVAMATNAFGPVHVLNFAKRCPNLKLLLHVSTAYVHGSRSGLLSEEPFQMGETLEGAEASYLDIVEEKRLVEETKLWLQTQDMTEKEITHTLKELGTKRANLHGWPNTYSFTKVMGEMNLGKLRENMSLVVIRPTIVSSTLKEPFPGWMEGLRTLDSIFVAMAKGKLKVFPGDPHSTLDIIPGDMVVNAILAAMAVHSSRHSHEFLIYQVGSSSRNPLKYRELSDLMYRYAKKNPFIDSKGKAINTQKLIILSSVQKFRIYIWFRYSLLLKILEMLNAISRNHYQELYTSSKRKIDLTLKLAELYEPYLFFSGIFGSANTQNLLMTVRENYAKAETMFYFDAKAIRWEEYFLKAHFPGIVEYVLKQ